MYRRKNYFITKICDKIFILAIVVTSCIGMDISRFVPNEIHGWIKQPKDEIYNPKTIFDYIDGAGEIYRSYNFRKLFVRHFTKVHQPNITVELFDMGSPEDAFGVFTHSCELGKEDDIGQDSEYQEGLLCFWQGNFFVCVYAEQETSSSKNAVLELGRTIATSIKTIGRKPKLLEYIPKKDLIKKDIRYFHNHTSLNHHYYVCDQNILNLNENTEVIFAKYKNKSYLLCIRYPNKKQAKYGFEKFITNYLPELKQIDIVQLENGNWSSAKVYNEFVVVVFDAPNKEYVKSLLKTVRKKLYE